MGNQPTTEIKLLCGRSSSVGIRSQMSHICFCAITKRRKIKISFLQETPKEELRGTIR